MSRILVVEDDEVLRNELIELLRNEGYEAEYISTFSDTAGQIIKSKPDLVLLDINIPELNGELVLRKLRKEADIPVIMVTSRTSESDEVLSMSYGADDYITKPFSASYLTTKIWNIIKQRKRIQALYYSQLIKNEEEGNSHPEEKEELELLPQTDKELLDKIVNFINNHLDNPDLTVDSLVEEAGISRSALFKKIKTLIGISPMELIKNIRLKKAAELVKEGSCNFTQIAYKTGFNDSQYFSKCFKNQFGIAPSVYQKNGGKAPASNDTAENTEQASEEKEEENETDV